MLDKTPGRGFQQFSSGSPIRGAFDDAIWRVLGLTGDPCEFESQGISNSHMPTTLDPNRVILRSLIKLWSGG